MYQYTYADATGFKTKVFSKQSKSLINKEALKSNDNDCQTVLQLVASIQFYENYALEANTEFFYKKYDDHSIDLLSTFLFRNN